MPSSLAQPRPWPGILACFQACSVVGFAGLVGWLASWFIGCLFRWSLGCSLGLLVVRSLGWLFVWLVVWLLGWFVVWLPGWRIVWLATWLEGGDLVGWYVGCWLARLFGWLAGWFGSTRQRLVPSPGALTEREAGGGQANNGNNALLFQVLLQIMHCQAWV